jgi:hypothetical protein
MGNFPISCSGEHHQFEALEQREARVVICSRILPEAWQVWRGMVDLPQLYSDSVFLTVF